jgi:hypothetical protein
MSLTQRKLLSPSYSGVAVRMCTVKIFAIEEEYIRREIEEVKLLRTYALKVMW